MPNSNGDNASSELERAVSRFGEMGMAYGHSDVSVEEVPRAIFAATASTTRHFGHIGISIHPESGRAFVRITLRWYARWNWIVLRWLLKRKRERWLNRAETRCRMVVPNGIRLVVYYGKRKIEDE